MSQATTVADSSEANSPKAIDKSAVESDSSSKVVGTVVEAKKSAVNNGSSSKVVGTVIEAKKSAVNNGSSLKVVESLSEAKINISRATDEATFKLSTDEESNDEDYEVFEIKKPRTDVKKDDGLPGKRAKTDVKGTSRKSNAGRPKGSKNVGPQKSTLLQNLSQMQDDGTLSIINCDEIASAGSRNLRSGTKKSNQSEDNGSSSLKAVDIGFDFDVKKSIDPRIQENLESCIITSLNMSWDDVIGLDEVKRGLKEAAVLPLNRPDLFVGYRKPPKGILLYGPPGTGKTMLGKCAASAANSTFFSITASDVMSKWMGDAEKTVAGLFQIAEKKQPSIIFIDEVDSLLTSRREGEHDCIRRIKTEFLAKWDGLSTSNARILVIGATNRPMDLDAAAMRRFTKHLYVPLPEREARKEMLKRFANDKSVQVSLSSTDISTLGCETVGFSAADMTNLLQDAAMMPMQRFTYEECATITAEELGPVTKDDILECLKNRKPTCDSFLIAELESWSAR